MTRARRFRGLSIFYILLVMVAENSAGFEASGGIILGHIATFTLFILLAAMLTSQIRNLLFESRPLQLAGA
jgi:hypothetical protein